MRSYWFIMMSPRLTATRLAQEQPAVAWALSTWMILTVVCFSLALAKPRSHTVYPIFTYAAGEWVAGRDVYVSVPGFDFFRYSPAVAAFFGPWQLLGDGWGGAIWRVLGVSLLSCGLVGWSRRVLKPGEYSDVAAVFLLVAPFALQNVHNGQSNPHVLGMLLLAAADVIDGRPSRAAGWLAAAALFKPYVLAIAGLMALIDSRLWLRLIVALAIGLTAPFLTQSSHYVADQYAAWIGHLLANDRGNMDLRDAYRDMALLFRVYIWPIPPVAYQAATAIAGLGLAALVIRGKGATVSKSMLAARAFSLGCCWVTALGPATESCTYLLLAPALAISLLTLPGHANWWARTSYSLFVGTIAASMFPQDWAVQVLGPQPIAGLILLIILVIDTLRWRQQKSQAHGISFAAAA